MLAPNSDAKNKLNGDDKHAFEKVVRLVLSQKMMTFLVLIHHCVESCREEVLMHGLHLALVLVSKVIKIKL